MSEAYQRAWRDSIENREAFWLAAAEGIEWIKTPQAAYAEDRGWFPGGTLNTAHNCIDRHVAAGRGDAIALAYDSPVTDTVRRYTYAELQDEVGRVAATRAKEMVGRKPPNQPLPMW